MELKTRLLILAAAMLLVGACGTPKIKNTEIDDTPQNRAILDLIEQYRAAYEARDAPAIIALASQQYMETGGTAGTEDDYDYDSLKAKLEGEDFTRVLKARLAISIKAVRVEGERAFAEMRIETRYQTHSLEEAKDPEWHMHADDNRMTFVQEDGKWKILSGM